MNLAATGLVGTLVVGVCLTLAATPAAAVVCSTQQITDTTGNLQTDDPHISADGTRIGFLSAGEFGDFGDNGDGNREAWLYDVTTGPAAMVQVTNTSSGNVSQLAMDDDGDRFALRSSSDGTPEIFLVDTTAATTTQITHTSAADTVDPAIDGAGTLIAFDSNRDHVPGNNADGNKEIFLYDVASSTTTQLTSTTNGTNEEPILSGDGTRLAFTSSSTQIGTNPEGNPEAHLRNLINATATQITTTSSGGSGPTAMNDAGTHVGLISTINIAGGNPDGNFEAFLFNPVNATTTQLTSTTGQSILSAVTSVNAAGTRLAIDSKGDLTGENPDLQSEVFLRDSQGHQGMFQVTGDPVEFAAEGDLSADGTGMAYRSSQDPVGANPDGNTEIFLATCGAVGPTFTDVPPSNVFYDQIQWMTSAEIASGFPNGTFKPQDAVKRQQMANFLYNLAGQPAFTPSATPTFTDVPTTNPFYAQIEWMAAEGIASGFPGGRFKPQDAVKRQQMANFLHNLAGQPAFTPPGTPTFTDVPTTNPFYAQIEWMVDEGIASGFPGGLFKPNDPVKRQQMANFLLNLANGPGVHLGEP